MFKILRTKLPSFFAVIWAKLEPTEIPDGNLISCLFLEKLTHCFVFSLFWELLKFPGTLRESLPASILGKNLVFEQSIMLKDSYERSLRAEFFWFLCNLIFFNFQFLREVKKSSLDKKKKSDMGVGRCPLKKIEFITNSSLKKSSHPIHFLNKTQIKQKIYAIYKEGVE